MRVYFEGLELTGPGGIDAAGPLEPAGTGQQQLVNRLRASRVQIIPRGQKQLEIRVPVPNRRYASPLAAAGKQYTHYLAELPEQGVLTLSEEEATQKLTLHFVDAVCTSHAAHRRGLALDHAYTFLCASVEQLLIAKARAWENIFTAWENLNTNWEALA